VHDPEKRVPIFRQDHAQSGSSATIGAIFAARALTGVGGRFRFRAKLIKPSKYQAKDDR
jgi:hypothetical protein